MAQILNDKLQAAFGRFHAGDLPGAERLCREILDEAQDPAALHLLGVVRLMDGGADEAVALIGRALEGRPQDPAMLEHLGLARLATRNHAGAEEAFRQAIALGQVHGQLFMRLGMALASQGKLVDALLALRQAATQSPEDPDVLLNLGNTLAEAGQSEAALGCFRRLLVLQPRHPVVRFNLGTLYRRLGRFDEARVEYEHALAIDPDDPDTHNNLGLVHEQQGRYDDAAFCYRQALVRKRDHAPALANLGNVLRIQGRLDEAVASLQQALAASPGDIDARINFGIVRMQQGLFGDAQALFGEVLHQDPRNFEAHFNLGELHLRQSGAARAIEHYRRALETGTQPAMAHRALGAAFLDAGDLPGAIESYRKALEIEPGAADTHFDLGEALKLAGRLDEAIAAYETALELNPDHDPALGAVVYLRQQIGAWPGLEGLWERMRRRIAAGSDGFSPFGVLYMPLSAQEQLACAKGWSRRTLGPVVAMRQGLGFSAPAPARGPRLRVGYLSRDFFEHATAYLMAELFELHDRDRFEIFIYSYGPDDGSAIRSRVRSAAGHFADVSRESYVETARRIRDDGIDVLVDLKGYTLGARPQILALRPAPVQVNWLGFPGSMGTDSIDCIIADPIVIPEGAEGGYSEKVVRLPECYQVNDRKREIAPAPSREECGLPGDAFVFCSFNQAAKLLPDVFAAWLRILKAVPGSVLWLLENNRWAPDNLRRAAADEGVLPGRLVFAQHKPLSQHLARYRLADLALDTFPYTSHTTASDALWAGCPLVTRTGETFASRVAGSIVRAAGLPELVTGSAAEYEALAIDLAASPERLRAAREKLRAGRGTCPLFDTDRFVRDLEDALGRMAGIGERA